MSWEKTLIKAQQAELSRHGCWGLSVQGGSAACRQPLDTILGSPAVELRLTHYTAPKCKEEIINCVWEGYRILSRIKHKRGLPDRDIGKY